MVCGQGALSIRAAFFKPYTHTHTCLVRTLGCLLTLLCAVIGFGIMLIGHAYVEDISSIPTFESEPREGYEYWARIKYWRDLRRLGLWLLQAWPPCLIAFIALLRHGRPLRRGKRGLDWGLLVPAGGLMLYWGYVLFRMALHSGSVGSVFVPAAFTQWAGCLYAVAVFMRRALFPSVSPAAPIDLPPGASPKPNKQE